MHEQTHRISKVFDRKTRAWLSSALKSREKVHSRCGWLEFYVSNRLEGGNTEK